MRWTAFQIFLVLILTAGALARPAGDASMSEKLNWIKAYAEAHFDGRSPGFSMSIMLNGGKTEIVSGYANLEDKVEMDSDTFSCVASVSKFVTSIWLNYLHTNGYIHWEKPMTAFCSSLRFADPYVQRLATFRDAMSHRLGFAAYGGDRAWQAGVQYTPAELLQSVGSLPIYYTFRQGQTKYSNIGVSIAAYCAAEAMNTTFEEGVRQMLKETGVSFEFYSQGTDALAAGRKVMTGYDASGVAGDATLQDQQMGYRTVLPAATVWTTPGELSRLNWAFLAGLLSTNYDVYNEAVSFTSLDSIYSYTNCRMSGNGPGYFRGFCPQGVKFLVHDGNSMSITTTNIIFPGFLTSVSLVSNRRATNLHHAAIVIETLATIFGLDRVVTVIPSNTKTNLDIPIADHDIDPESATMMPLPGNDDIPPSNSCDQIPFSVNWTQATGYYYHSYYGMIQIVSTNMEDYDIPETNDDSLPAVGLALIYGESIAILYHCNNGFVVLQCHTCAITNLLTGAVLRFVEGLTDAISAINLFFIPSDESSGATFVRMNALEDPVYPIRTNLVISVTDHITLLADEYFFGFFVISMSIVAVSFLASIFVCLGLRKKSRNESFDLVSEREGPLLADVA